MGIHWKAHGTIEVFDFDNITTLEIFSSELCSGKGKVWPPGRK
jgi:hypothetical protein